MCGDVLQAMTPDGWMEGRMDGWMDRWAMIQNAPITCITGSVYFSKQFFIIATGQLWLWKPM